MLDILGVSPQDSLMVGDHPLDILTGQRVGAMTLGVTCGHASRDQLKAASPDGILEHCGQLITPNQP
jgi:phosphoglycolate phosphatase